MGIIAYYCGKYEEGKQACLKAIEAGNNVELDKKNLQFYLDQEKRMNNNDKVSNNIITTSKKEFMLKTIEELSKSTKMSNMKIQKLALQRWKSRQK